MYVCAHVCAHICVHTMGIRVLRKPVEDIRFPGSRIAGSCKQPDVCWELDSDPLHVLQAFLTIESSLQLVNVIILFLVLPILSSYVFFYLNMFLIFRILLRLAI